MNKTLATLDLNSNDLRSEHAAALSNALKTNQALETLNLSQNKVGDAGATALAEALETNATLTTLLLSINTVRDAGAVALAKALDRNTTLKTLELNYVGSSGSRALGAVYARRGVLVLLSAPIVRGGSAERRLLGNDASTARRLIDNDGDHAIVRRVLGFLL